MKYLVSHLFTLFISCFFAYRVNAMVVSPAVIEMELSLGQTTTTLVTLTNSDSRYKIFTTSILPFMKGEKSGVPVFYQNDDQGVVGWTKVEQQITLQPGQSMVVPITITIPKDAASKGYFEAVFFEDQSVQDGQVKIAERIGVLLFVDVEGGINKHAQLEIENVKMAKRITSSLSNALEYTVYNPTETFQKPVGLLKVSGLVVRDRVVQANPLQSRLLPKERRSLMAGFGDTSPITTFVDGLKREWKYFGLGKVSVSIEFQQKQFVESFFVIPWRMASVVGIMLLIIMLMRRWYRHLNNGGG